MVRQPQLTVRIFTCFLEARNFLCKTGPQILVNKLVIFPVQPPNLASVTPPTCVTFPLREKQQSHSPSSVSAGPFLINESCTLSNFFPFLLSLKALI